MSVVNVYHRSRDRIYTLNFTSDGETSWAFTADGDGEVYDIVTDNISSFTINGNSVLLPFTITNGNSYSVAITKTTPGQTASITLKTRRDTDKSSYITVPDFSVGDGRYLFALNENRDTVYVVDTSLLVGTNYLGSGSFTTSPILYSITLPILPNNTNWRTLCYIINDGVGKILLVSDFDTTNDDIYFCKIINNNVYDLSETVQDSYTLFSGYSGVVTDVSPYLFYDYINNRVYFYAYFAYWLDVNNNTLHSEDRFSNVRSVRTRFFDSLSYGITWFNPVTEEFAALSDFNYINQEITNYRVYGGSNKCVYSRDENKYFHHVINPLDVYAYTRNGSVIQRYRFGDYPGTTNAFLIGSDYLGLGTVVTKQSSPKIGVFSYSTSNMWYYNNSFSFRGVINGFQDISVSNFSSIFLLLDSGSDSTSIRLHSYDSTGELSYFDFPEDIVKMCTNQLLV